MADVVAGLAVFGAVIAVGWLLVRTRAVPADADGDDRAEDRQSRHHIGHHRHLSSTGRVAGPVSRS